MKFNVRTLEEFYRYQPFSMWKDSTVLCLIYLYHGNKISKESLLSHYNNLINDKTSITRNAYHSKINDKWYNDMCTYEIFKDIVDDVLPRNFEISFDDMVNYLNIITGKRKNACVLFIMDGFIKPLIVNLMYREPSAYDIEDYFNKYFNHKLDDVTTILDSTKNNVSYYHYEDDYEYEREVYNKPVVNNYIKKKLHKYAKSKLTGRYWLNPLYVETANLDYTLNDTQHIFDCPQPFFENDNIGLIIKK